MRGLRCSELAAILAELHRQKTTGEYHDLRDHWAFLASVIVNSAQALATSMSGRKRKPKPVTPEDFIGKDLKEAMKQLMQSLPGEKETQSRRGADRAALIGDAKAKGLKGPW